MKILVVASEMEGLVKTGGLADVVRGLSAALKASGVDIRVVIPYYKQQIKQTPEVLLPNITVSLGANCHLGVAVRHTEVSGVPVYLIEHDRLYDRRGIYDDGYSAFEDNGLRYGLLSKAALTLCESLQWFPDVVHCNDWQTAILPYYLKRHFAGHAGFKKTRSLLTLHNGFFQGRIPNPDRITLGIAESDYIPSRFEDHHMVNLLKGGVAFADGINAVSPGYRDELLNPETSHGLWQAYQAREKDFVGILNGCDYGHWDPETDPLISKQFKKSALSGKKHCKKALQKAMGLPHKAGVPVCGIVSRLTDQKGFYYLIPTLERLLASQDMPFQVVILGDGDPVIANQLIGLQTLHPDRIRFHRGYSDALAHEIEAGSDFFLMPSLFEPCGLNQIYSLKYGTLPIVRSVGGLKNTVVGLADDHANQAIATGFSFNEANNYACQAAVEQAISLWYLQPDIYATLQQNAMSQDYSWAAPAKAYQALYRSLKIKNVT
jgi:starch synthase